MARETRRIPAVPRLGRLAGLVGLSVVGALLLLTPAWGQETPEASPSAEATPPASPPADGTPGVGTTDVVIRIEIEAEELVVPVGDTILARVVVENVEHLAGFGFTMNYDPDMLRPVEGTSDTGGTPEGPEATPDPNVSEGGELIQVEELGAFLEDSERSQISEISGGLVCSDPIAQGGQVGVNCNTLGPPLCLGGGAGASGSGVLAVVPFESRGGGVTALELTESTLVLDDLEPCDPVEGSAVAIEHQVEGASIELAEKDSSSMLIIIIVIVAVVVVAAAGGAFGYRWYRQRSS